MALFIITSEVYFEINGWCDPFLQCIIHHKDDNLIKNYVYLSLKREGLSRDAYRFIISYYGLR